MGSSGLTVRAMAQPAHSEYDDYVRGYRREQSRQLWLTGETGEFFAGFKVQRLRGWLPDLSERPAAILDYGCGDGLMTSYLKRFFPAAAVSGIDPSLRSIELARRRHPGIGFECVQSLELPLVSAAYDLVVASGVIHHIPLAEHRRALNGIFRVLKPGGWFFLDEMNPFNPLSAWVFNRSPFDKNARMIFPDRARRLLRGYGELSLKYYIFFPRFLSALRSLESALEWLPLGAHYACIVKKGETEKREMECTVS